MPAGRRPDHPVSRFTFDMPHALVTLTDVDGDVEIEVWPKSGQSAYVVVPPPIARAIADQISRMADAAEHHPPGSGATDEVEPDEVEPEAGPPAPSNVVSLASRRRPG
jgi:hypothetical protein